MRDALSLLDQVLACGGSEVDDGYVMMLLGTMDRKILFDLSEAVFADDLSRVLTVIDDAFKHGHDLKRFYAEVLNHFRHLMLIKVNASPDLLVDLSTGEVEELKKQIGNVTIAFIDQVYTLLFDAEPAVRRSLQPRPAIEMVFFKIHQIKPALPIDLLIERMDQLLKDPGLRSSTGIVETQAGYGDVPGQPKNGSNPAPSTDNREADAGPGKNISARARDVDRLPHQREELDQDPWSRVIGAASKMKPSVGAALPRLKLVSVSEMDIFVKVRENDFSAKMVKKNLALIEKVCRDTTGKSIHVDFTVDSVREKQVEKAKQQNDTIKRQLLNHPLVADAVDVFNGKIDEIKIK
jgi:DNA polymerase-3 subunit gamma/tau